MGERYGRASEKVDYDPGLLVPIRLGKAEHPIDTRAIETTDFDDWDRDVADAPFRKLVRALQTMLGMPSGEAVAQAQEAGSRTVKRVSVCVLRFANMRAEPGQDYFSDGVTQDIIVALARISALAVISRTSCVETGVRVDFSRLAPTAFAAMPGLLESRL